MINMPAFTPVDLADALSSVDPLIKSGGVNANLMAQALGPQDSSGAFGTAPVHSLLGLGPEQVLALAKERADNEYKNMLTSAGVLDFSRTVSGQKLKEQAALQGQQIKAEGALANAKMQSDERQAQIHGMYQLESQRIKNAADKDLMKADRIKALSMSKITAWHDYQQKLKDNPESVKGVAAPSKPTSADYMNTGYYKDLMANITTYNQLKARRDALEKSMTPEQADLILGFDKNQLEGMKQTSDLSAELLGISKGESPTIKETPQPPADWVTRFKAVNKGATDKDAADFWAKKQAGGK